MKFLIENRKKIELQQSEKMKEYWKFEDKCIETLNNDGINHDSIRVFCRKNYKTAKLWDIEKVYNTIKTLDANIEKNKEWSLKYIDYFKRYYTEFPFDNTWTFELEKHYNSLSESDKAFYDVLEDFEKSMRKHFKGYTVKELCEILKRNEENRKEHLIKILENWS